MLKTSVILLIFSFSFYSCSSSVEETRNEEVNNEAEEPYVFDEIPESDVTEEALKKEVYLIQIGAFTTKPRAEKFAEESKDKLSEDVSVLYESEINLFVVRLNKKFNTKKDAEAVRDRLKEIEEFKDAWIISSSNNP